MEKVCCSTKKL